MVWVIFFKCYLSDREVTEMPWERESRVFFDGEVIVNIRATCDHPPELSLRIIPRTRTDGYLSEPI